MVVQDRQRVNVTLQGDPAHSVFMLGGLFDHLYSTLSMERPICTGLFNITTRGTMARCNL